jgi:hypothetical protein
MGNARNSSLQASRSPRISGELQREKVVLYREDQRVSLRAFLRTFLQNEQIAESKAMYEFLTGNPVKLNLEELDDVQRRKDMDERRIEEQRRFYEVARERARELDIYMERFRRDVIESSMLKPESTQIKHADERRRRAHQTLQGDQGKGKNRRPQPRVSEICGMVTNRVSVIHINPAFTVRNADSRVESPQQSTIFSSPKTILQNC